MQNRKILISAIIPVYNSELFLEQCLDSILNQTLKEIEIICVDDGSTDSSLELLNKYATLDNRVTIIQQENLYAGVARNTGFDVAKGEYVHFMDSDDYLELDAYENMYSIVKNFNADFVKARSYELDFVKNEIVQLPANHKYALSTIDSCDFNRPMKLDLNTWRIFLKKIGCNPWNGIYRSSFLRSNSIKFNDLRCVNDRSFYLQLLLKAQTIVVSDMYIITHRINRTTSLLGIRIENFDCHFKSYELAEKFCINLDAEYKAIMLNEELNDIFISLNRYCENEVYGAKIMESTSEFINNVDGDFFDEYLPDDFKNRCTLIKEVLSLHS